MKTLEILTFREAYEAKRGNSSEALAQGLRMSIVARDALVAQLVEQWFCKPKVAGSTPAGGTITIHII